MSTDTSRRFFRLQIFPQNTAKNKNTENPHRVGGNIPPKIRPIKIRFTNEKNPIPERKWGYPLAVSYNSPPDKQYKSHSISPHHCTLTKLSVLVGEFQLIEWSVNTKRKKKKEPITLRSVNPFEYRSTRIRETDVQKSTCLYKMTSVSRSHNTRLCCASICGGTIDPPPRRGRFRTEGGCQRRLKM
ncbi:hypothetical protein CEXT_805351 [Caerostris extrusa]|uniref:Uncharacterized protein n=1 Tax=Caerostris extrusa TaxID=172846 RepID=A0AAV4W533_CAEEX|nr:hypothetical protein CEXT_805351 [Caerostris extrusa]